MTVKRLITIHPYYCAWIKSTNKFENTPIMKHLDYAIKILITKSERLQEKHKYQLNRFKKLSSTSNYQNILNRKKKQ